MKRLNVFSLSWLLTESRLELLQQYSDEVEDFISSKFKKFVVKAEEITKEYSEDMKEDYYDFHYDDFVQYRDEYPSVLRYSTVTAAHSTLEQALMKIHYQKSKDRKAYRKYKKKNSDIAAVIEFLREEMHLDIPQDSKEIIFINNLTKVRNNIVHSNGRTYDDNFPERLENLITENPNLDIVSGEIVIKKEYIDEMLKTIKSFLGSIYQELEKRYT